MPLTSTKDSEAIPKHSAAKQPAVRLEYAVISVQFDPITGTDHLLTRQEIVSSSLAEAEQSQSELIPQLKGNYRCYIQERMVHVFQVGKRATSIVEKHEILGCRSIVEVTQ